MKSESTAIAQELQATREEMTKNLAGAAGGVAGFAKDLGARSLHDVAEALADARTAVSEGGEEVVGMASAFVRAHPVKALAVAAAAGLLVGLLVAPRSP